MVVGIKKEAYSIEALHQNYGKTLMYHVTDRLGVAIRVPAR